MDDDCFDLFLANPPTHCACCNKELDYKSRRSPLNPSFDRIRNDLSYVIGNVAVICFGCNSLKRDGSIADFEQIIAYMQRAMAATCDSALA